MHGFSQRLPVDWLREHLAAEATHYLFPTLVQRLTHRPEVPPQWRCQQLLTVNTGKQVWGRNPHSGRDALVCQAGVYQVHIGDVRQNCFLFHFHPLSGQLIAGRYATWQLAKRAHGTHIDPADSSP